MLKAQNDVVFLDPCPIAEKTEGGIVLSAKRELDNFLFARVVAVGPGIKVRNENGYSGERIAPEVQKEDIVLYDKRIAGPVFVTGQPTLLACRVGELLGVVEEI